MPEGGSSMVKALGLALRKGPPQMAACTRCGAMLVGTTLIPYKEFVCVNCGNTLDFVSPDGKTTTPELEAEAWARKEVWKSVMNNHEPIEWLAKRREEWREQTTR